MLTNSFYLFYRHNAPVRELSNRRANIGQRVNNKTNFFFFFFQIRVVNTRKSVADVGVVGIQDGRMVEGRADEDVQIPEARLLIYHPRGYTRHIIIVTGGFIKEWLWKKYPKNGIKYYVNSVGGVAARRNPLFFFFLSVRRDREIAMFSLSYVFL